MKMFCLDFSILYSWFLYIWQKYAMCKKLVKFISITGLIIKPFGDDLLMIYWRIQIEQQELFYSVLCHFFQSRLTNIKFGNKLLFVPNMTVATCFVHLALNMPEVSSEITSSHWCTSLRRLLTCNVRYNTE